jgi:hypothetical protein
MLEDTMAFDKNLDKELFSKEAVFDTTKIVVSVYSYNEGTPKMQLSRLNLDQESGEFDRFAKLGRLLKEEAQAIMPLMQEALEKL